MDFSLSIDAFLFQLNMYSLTSYCFSVFTIDDNRWNEVKSGDGAQCTQSNT